MMKIRRRYYKVPLTDGSFNIKDQDYPWKIVARDCLEKDAAKIVRALNHIESQEPTEEVLACGCRPESLCDCPENADPICDEPTKDISK
jgi:hypothetical protein